MCNQLGTDLTILRNLSQIHQKGNQLGGFDDFDEFFAIFCYCMHFWTYFRKGRVNLVLKSL